MMKNHNIFPLLIIVLMSAHSFTMNLHAQTLDLVESIDLSGEPANLIVQDSLVLIGGENPLLQIVNVSHPSEPSFEGAFDTAALSWNLYAADQHVYIAAGWEGLFIIDISDPASPELAGSFVTDVFFHDVAVRNDTAYILACHDFYTLDISDFSDPFVMGDTFLFVMDAWNFFMEGNNAYIVDTINRGMIILNIDDPFHPLITSHYEGIVYGNDISIVQDYAYIPYSSGLQIVNIADPSNPFIFNAVYFMGHPYRIFCADNYAFMTNGYYDGGIHILDISEPANPQSVLYYNEYSYKDAQYSDGYLYALRDPGTLDIFRILTPTSIDEQNKLPARIGYLQSYPNPFNSATTISFNLKEAGTAALSIYNIQGQRVAELLNGIQQVGEHSITWDASEFPSGIYFARLEAGGSSRTAKMVLLK